MKTVLLTLDGPDAFAAMASKDALEPMLDTCVNSDIRNSLDTDFAPTHRDTLSRLAIGWSEGKSQMEAALAQASLSVAPISVASTSFDVAGYYPSVPHAVSGDPENMINFDECATRTRPIIRLGVENTASGSIGTDQIVNRGAAILAHIDALEAAGFRVELTLLWRGANTSTKGHDTVAHSIELVAKRAEEPLNLDWLAFVLAHPGVLRRIILGHYTVAPDFAAMSKVHGYGYPAIKEQAHFEGGVYLPSLNHDTSNYFYPDRATKAIADILNREIPRVYGDAVEALHLPNAA
jgi:hypothetical protein